MKESANCILKCKIRQRPGSRTRETQNDLKSQGPPCVCGHTRKNDYSQTESGAAQRKTTPKAVEASFPFESAHWQSGFLLSQWQKLHVTRQCGRRSPRCWCVEHPKFCVLSHMFLRWSSYGGLSAFPLPRHTNIRPSLFSFTMSTRDLSHGEVTVQATGTVSIEEKHESGVLTHELPFSSIIY